MFSLTKENISMFQIHIKVKILKNSLFERRGVIEDDELVQGNSEKYFGNQWKHIWKNNPIIADYIWMMR